MAIKSNETGIPDYELESLSRVLLPIIQKYLTSEQGKKDFAEWQENQLNRKVNNK